MLIITVNWVWPSTNCSYLQNAIVAQMQKWVGRSNCPNGGQKCLYEFKRYVQYIELCLMVNISQNNTGLFLLLLKPRWHHGQGNTHHPNQVVR